MIGGLTKICGLVRERFRPRAGETRPSTRDMPTEGKHDLCTGRSLSEDEIARCRSIAGELAQLDRQSDAGSWVTPGGMTVHGHVSRIGFEHVDPGFLNRLRHHSCIFTGYRLTNLLGLTHDAHYSDAYAGFFDKAGTAPDWSVPAFREYVKELEPQDIFSPPLIMGEVGYNVGGYCVNRDVITYQERINLMREFGVLDHLRSKRAPLILEIGGGYGALAYFLKRRYPRARYVIVDLPRSLLFSGCYLAAALPGAGLKVFKPGDEGIGPESVTLVANFLLDQLSLPAVDVAINTLSFAEMPAETVASYGRWLERHLASDGLLFEQNFDNRHLGAAHFSNPAEILSGIFRLRLGRKRRLWHRLRRKSGLLWGNANLWQKRADAGSPEHRP
jgi:putative sugar O-methyltransferase